MKKTLLSLLLLTALLLNLCPFGALAEEPEAGSEPEEATEESREGQGNLWSLPADDVLWFGVYKDKPVAWLVLDADQTNMLTEGVYLFSRDLIDSTLVRFDESSTLWEGSLAQEWCTNFAASAFSEAESALVPATDQIEPATYPDHVFGLTWRQVELKGEQVFFLSVQELARYYGTYSPENKRTVKRCSMESYYWLRSPHYYHDDYHGIVLQDSYIHDKLPYEPWAARPCANLYIQDAIWVLPADDPGAVGAVPLPIEQEREIHEWKLIVPLAEHAFTAETVSAKDGQLTVAYSGADLGEGAMLTLLIRDAEGLPLSLTRLEKPAAAEGSVTLQLQDVPEGAELFLFCEQLNGATRSNYASPLQQLSIEMPAAEEPAPAVEDLSQDAAGAEQTAEPEQTEEPEPTEAPLDEAAAAEPAETEEPAEEAAPAEEIPAAEQDDSAAAQPQTAGAEEQTPAKAEDADHIRSLIWQYLPLAVLALFLLLAIILFAIAFRRASVKPVILLLLLGLLLFVLYLRLPGAQLPEKLLPFLKDLF